MGDLKGLCFSFGLGTGVFFKKKVLVSEDEYEKRSRSIITMSFSNETDGMNTSLLFAFALFDAITLLFLPPSGYVNLSLARATASPRLQMMTRPPRVFDTRRRKKKG